MTPTAKPHCESCGLLMLDDAEHGAGNPDNPRCHLCTRPDGTPLGYGETVLSHALYLRSKAGAGPEEAEQAAREILAGNPAWKDREEKDAD